MSLRKSRVSSEAQQRLEHQLHIIPSGTYSLCKVLLKKVLLFHSNRLVSLIEPKSTAKEDFVKLKYLLVLDAHSNALEELPIEVDRLERLKILNLAGNKLSFLPSNIGHLKCLVELNLQNNKFKELPEGICYLSRLQKLNISSNFITRLPSLFYRLNRLEQLNVDVNQMIHPSADICAGGCEAVMRYLCNQASVDYMSPCRSESPKNIIDNVQTADSIDSTLRRTYLDDGYGGAPRRIFDYENLKEERRKKQLQVEDDFLKSKEAEATLLASSNANRVKVLDLISRDQNVFDSQVFNLQQHKDLEKQRFIEALRQMELHSNKIIQDILQYNQLARQTERLLEEEERLRMKEEKELRVKRDEYNRLQKKEVQAVLAEILSQNYSLEQLCAMNQRRQQEYAGKILKEEAAENARTEQVLASKDRLMHSLLSQLVNDENAQKEAIEALLLQRDAKTNRINKEIELIQSELAQISILEMKNRDLKISFQQETLDKQRHELCKMLQQLMDEKRKRHEELKLRIKEMEMAIESQQMDYWLVQLQNLLQNKPQILKDAEAQLEVEVVKILNQSGAEMFIPAFARHRVTMKALSAFTEEDLQKVGMYQIGLRKTVLQNVANYISTKKTGEGEETTRRPRLPSAPTEEEVHPYPSAPSLEVRVVETHFEAECVICMSTGAKVVFLPCGHVCCCSNCSERVVDCPMCRGKITCRVDLSSVATLPTV